MKQKVLILILCSFSICIIMYKFIHNSSLLNNKETKDVNGPKNTSTPKSQIILDTPPQIKKMEAIKEEEEKLIKEGAVEEEEERFIKEEVVEVVEEDEEKEEFTKCEGKIHTFDPFTANDGFDLKFLRRHPNLPLFLVKAQKLSKLIPSVYQIRWSSGLFQESWKDHPNCFLYSANFDARLRSGLIVRIMSICEIKFDPIDFYCQFLYNETENPVVSTVYEAGFPGRGKRAEMKPTLMACKVPPINDFGVPIAVSIVKNRCSKPTNILNIGGSHIQKDTKVSKTSKQNITIGLCGKAIFYYNTDYSLRLIEWVELFKILGISKFFLYRTLCHENVEKVLDYYEKEGTAEVINFRHPDPSPQEGTFLRRWIYPYIEQFASNERVYYNDCILKNKDNFDYLAIFDYDEIPVLKKHENLQQFIEYAKKSKKSENATGFSLYLKLIHSNLKPVGEAKTIPEDLYVLRHNYQHHQFGGYVKTIYDTNKVLYVACHQPEKFDALPPLSSKVMHVPKSIAYTGHYKNTTCNSECAKGPFEEENRFLQYLSELNKRMRKIRNELKI